jgi:hypothetical protein
MRMQSLIGIDMNNVSSIHVFDVVEKEWDGARWKQTSIRFRFNDGQEYTIRAYTEHTRGEQDTADLAITVGGNPE